MFLALNKQPYMLAQVKWEIQEVEEEGAGGEAAAASVKVGAGPVWNLPKGAAPSAGLTPLLPLLRAPLLLHGCLCCRRRAPCHLHACGTCAGTDWPGGGLLARLCMQWWGASLDGAAVGHRDGEGQQCYVLRRGAAPGRQEPVCCLVLQCWVSRPAVPCCVPVAGSGHTPGLDESGNDVWMDVKVPPQLGYSSAGMTPTTALQRRRGTSLSWTSVSDYPHL